MTATTQVPNRRLQQVRIRHGLSQENLAQLLGTTQQAVARWESGKVSPSAYYRQKLRVLLNATDEALGLAGISEALAPAVATHTSIFDPLVPMYKPLVGRTGLLHELLDRVVSGHTVALSALRGLPGVGKTALAVALLHEAAMRTHFPDGLLWAGLGPHPNLIGILSRWGSLLGVQESRLTTIEEWSERLRTVIGQRRMLLVLDDAWKIDDAFACKVGGPQCAYVLTTRYTPIALQFAQQSEVLTVHELEEKESMTLLTHLVPNIQEAQARHLVQVVGGLPLALMLMGKYLLLQSYSGQPRRIQAAFDRLGKIDERFSLSAPQAALESTPTLSQAQPITMQDIIKVSDSHLSPQAQASLRALSVFPAKPNTFSEAAALAVANTSFEVLDELSDVGLLESGNSDRYTPRCRF